MMSLPSKKCSSLSTVMMQSFWISSSLRGRTLTTVWIVSFIHAKSSGRWSDLPLSVLKCTITKRRTFARKSCQMFICRICDQRNEYWNWNCTLACFYGVNVATWTFYTSIRYKRDLVLAFYSVTPFLLHFSLLKHTDSVIGFYNNHCIGVSRNTTTTFDQIE